MATLVDATAHKNVIYQLKEIFPNKPEATIRDMVDLAINQNPLDGPEYILENAVTLLASTGFDEQNEAAGYQDDCVDWSANNQLPTDEELSCYYDRLVEMFSDCCTLYLREFLEKNNTLQFNELCDELINSEYPKRCVDPMDILQQLREMLPDADPNYLEKQARSLAYKSTSDLKVFIENAIENADYPTMQDYHRFRKETQEIRQYTDGFNIKTYLQIIPNPMEYFSDPNRKHSLMPSDTEENDETLSLDKEYALEFLCNHYRFHRIKDITKVYHSYKFDLIKTANRIEKLPKTFKKPRNLKESNKECKNKALLQEIAFVQHKKRIREFFKWKDENYRLARLEAERNGLLETCQCCFYSTLIPEECYFCKKGCIFCKECIKLGAETVIGKGELHFPCLAECDSEFSIPTLQMVLDSVVFSRMAQRKQFEEIKRAEIQGLETCPYCDFCTIPAPEDKIFKCLNEECMKETCRQCRHLAHIPLRCNEIEYDEDVKMRTYIENKMTEALLRKCWKCSKVFIKESGCNKMTCRCGAIMCYVCGQRVADYSHFGNGSRCPLYTTNLNRFHMEAVLRGAEQAKNELGVNVQPDKLKNDPAKDVQQHFPLD